MGTNFNKPLDIEQSVWGTTFTQGVRVGPKNSTSEAVLFPPDTVRTIGSSQPSGQLALLDQYGYGMYPAPIAAYTINPCATIRAAAFANIVSQVDIYGLPVGYDFPLAGETLSPRQAQKVPTPDGGVALQLDYPRTLQMTTPQILSEGEDIVVMVDGEDLYGQPITTQLYIQGDGAAVTVKTNASLFYVKRVYLSKNTAPEGTNIYITCSDGFGLPYVLSEVGHVMQYCQYDDQWAGWTSTTGHYPPGTNLSYGGQTLTQVGYLYPQDANPEPTTWGTPYYVGLPRLIVPGLQRQNYFNTDFYNPNCLDVRGVVYPNNEMEHTPDESGNPLLTALQPGNCYSSLASSSKFSLMYYCQGFDLASANQENAIIQIAKNRGGNPQIFDGMWSQLPDIQTEVLGKGVPPYYSAEKIITP